MTYANWVPTELRKIHETAVLLDGLDSQILPTIKSKFDSLLSNSLSEGPWEELRKALALPATRERDIAVELCNPALLYSIFGEIRTFDKNKRYFEILDKQVATPSAEKLTVFEHCLVYDFLAGSFWLAEVSEPMKRWDLTTDGRDELIEEARKNLIRLERSLDKLEIPISDHRVRLSRFGNLASSTGPIWWPAKESGDEYLMELADFITGADWFRDIVKPSIERELAKLSKVKERKPVHNKQADIYAAQLSGDCENRFGKPMYPQVAAIIGVLFGLPGYDEKKATRARQSINKLTPSN